MPSDYTMDIHDDPFWSSWAKYLDHVTPSDGRPTCQTCAGGQTPNDGCEEGRKLYGDYRLAKISRGSTVSS